MQCLHANKKWLLFFYHQKSTEYIYICVCLQAWIFYCLQIEYKYIQTLTHVYEGEEEIYEKMEERKGEEEEREGERERGMKG